MLSHSLHELRQSVLADAHGGRFMSADELVGLAAKLAAYETAAANLEEAARMARTLSVMAFGMPTPLRRTFGRRIAGRIR